jgi:hypothetical protein
MAYTVLIHLLNEEPVKADMDELPSPQDTLFVAKNPRARDDKDLRYLDTNVTTVIWPISRLTFLEVLPSGEEEKVVSFVRER